MCLVAAMVRVTLLLRLSEVFTQNALLLSDALFLKMCVCVLVTAVRCYSCQS